MATLKIKADVTELKKIQEELKRMGEVMKPLRKRKKEIEENILNYMKSNGKQGLQGIKLNDMEIVAVEKKTHQKLNKSEKESTGVQLLQQSGVTNPRKVYHDLQEMLKGKEDTKQALKMMEKGGFSKTK